MLSIANGARAAIVYPLSRLRSFEERLGVIVFTGALLLAMSHGLFAHEFKAGDLDINHPWSRATPQGAAVAAGYLSVTNNGSTPDRLVSVTAEIAERAEIHEMSVDSAGVMKMQALPDGLDIPAAGKVELKPGSFHIMFLGLKNPVKQGDMFKGTLTFEKAGTVAVEFKAEAMSGQTEHNGHGK